MTKRSVILALALNPLAALAMAWRLLGAVGETRAYWAEQRRIDGRIPGA